MVNKLQNNVVELKYRQQNLPFFLNLSHLNICISNSMTLKFEVYNKQDDAEHNVALSKCIQVFATHL